MPWIADGVGVLGLALAFALSLNRVIEYASVTIGLTLLVILLVAAMKQQSEI